MRKTIFTILLLSISAMSAWTYEVDANHVYYFFQQAYPDNSQPTASHSGAFRLSVTWRHRSQICIIQEISRMSSTDLTEFTVTTFSVD